jgi:threonyl-tRNA synthetase
MSSKKNAPNNLEILRHSLSHLMTMAVLELYPKTGLGVGMPIENGFYQDYDLPEKISEDILPKLEKRMKELIKENIDFVQNDVNLNDAFEFYKDDPYKTELIQNVIDKGEKQASFYDSGKFHNLCKGPHIKNTRELNVEAFKLTKLAGAYWRGDEKNKMLQRIYGVAFQTKKELDEYLHMLEEAEKRDHKKLGREIDLFSFHAEAPGAPFWHPKGMVIWNILENLGKNLREKYAFKEIQTPIIAKRCLWEISGHWDHYQDSMFHFKSDDEEYAVKPMDCPFNILIYKEKQKSYKDLPLRLSEIGRVFRNEKSGELNGLLRVRHITQDDSHTFLAKSQVKDEIRSIIKMACEYYNCFGMKPQFYFSTRPEDFMGKVKDWDEAEKDLESALKAEKVKYELKEKDGAFYGPKIDIDIKDALGRRWQLATIQLDFQLPQRFELEYIDKNGKKEQPVMIHAAVFGSFERFIGIITEHFAGAFPTWLSPVQVEIIPVSEKFNPYAEKINNQLSASNIRVEISKESATLGKRIREAEKQKIPYMLVVGEKEEKDNSVAVRSRGDKNQEVLKVEKFIEKIIAEIKNKK